MVKWQFWTGMHRRSNFMEKTTPLLTKNGGMVNLFLMTPIDLLLLSLFVDKFPSNA